MQRVVRDPARPVPAGLGAGRIRPRRRRHLRLPRAAARAAGARRPAPPTGCRTGGWRLRNLRPLDDGTPAACAADRLRRAALRGQQPRPGGAAALAGTQPGPARHPARGRARAGARRQGRDLLPQPGQPVGPAPAPRAPVPAARFRPAVPARCRRVHRLPAAARLAAAAQLRGRDRQLRLLPAGAGHRQLAGTLRLDGPGGRALVADLRRRLLHRRRQAGARHEAGRAGLEAGQVASATAPGAAGQPAHAQPEMQQEIS